MGGFDWGGAAGGAAGGAQMGAFGGPVGIGVGALLGGALGGFGGSDTESPEDQMKDMLSLLFDYQQGPHIANQLLANMFGMTGEQSNAGIRKQMILDLKAQGIDVPNWVLNPKAQSKKRNQMERWESNIAKMEEGGVTEKEQSKYDKLVGKRDELQGFLDMPSTWADLNPKASPVMDYIQNPIQLTGAEQQIANALGLTMPGEDPVEPGTGGIDLFGDLAETGDYLRNTVIPMTEDLARTGWKVDIDPIVQEELRRFNMETVPGLAEKYGMTGSGLGSYLGRGAVDLGTRIGSKEYDAGEAAAERRLFGLGQLPRVATLPSIFEQEGLSNIMNLGQDMRGAAEATRPGSRLLNALSELTGTASGMGIPMMMKPEEGAGMGGALSSLLSSPNFPGMGQMSGLKL